MPATRSRLSDPIIGLLPTLALLMTAVACAPQKVVTRTGNTWTCVEQARKAPNRRGTDGLPLGWVSVAPVDRWIAAGEEVAIAFGSAEVEPDVALNTGAFSIELDVDLGMGCGEEETKKKDDA